jgi:WD40 repeat protein
VRSIATENTFIYTVAIHDESILVVGDKGKLSIWNDG